MLASLNHPHIGAIYSLEEADGVRALVLELIEGETLADKLLHLFPLNVSRSRIADCRVSADCPSDR